MKWGNGMARDCYGGESEAALTRRQSAALVGLGGTATAALVLGPGRTREAATAEPDGTALPSGVYRYDGGQGLYPIITDVY